MRALIGKERVQSTAYRYMRGPLTGESGLDVAAHTVKEIPTADLMG